MARKSLWLALVIFTLALGPILVPLDAQQRCPWAMKMQMSQQANVAYKMQMQQQMMMQKKMQQMQMMQMKQSQRMQQMARPIQPTKITPRPPVMTYKPPKVTQFQPPAMAMNKMKLMQQQKMQTIVQKKMITQRNMTQKMIQPKRGTGPGMGKMAQPRVNTQLVQKQIQMQKQVMIRNQKLMKSRTTYKPPPVRVVIPAKRQMKTQQPRIAQKMPPMQQKKLVLPEPVRRQMVQKGNMEKKQAMLTAKKMQVNTNKTTVKMDMSCVNCHKKMKINLNNPIPGKQPALPAMIAQKPRPNNPLQAPIAGPPRLPVVIDCGPAPRNPIAGVPLRLPTGIAGPLNPFRLPTGIAGPPDGTPRNPWTDSQPKLVAGVSPQGIRKPGFPGMPAAQGVGPLQNPLAASKQDAGSPQDKKRTATKDSASDWRSPAMPAMPPSGELFLLNPVEARPAVRTRETNDPAPEPATPRAVAGGRLDDLDGPSLPPLPRSARILNTGATWEGETKDEDWYSPQLASRSVRAASVASEVDLSRPALPPLASRVLLP